MAETLTPNQTELAATPETSKTSVAELPTQVRETRPGDVAEALMYASAAGVAVEAEDVDHGVSHVCHGGEAADPEMLGVAVVSREAEPPTRVTLHDDDAGVTSRRLLDMSLMKLGTAGTRMIRVQSAEATLPNLWPAAGWLGTLPDLSERAEARRWTDALEACPAGVIDVVQRALGKAEAALRDLDVEASLDPEPDETSEHEPTSAA
ncbi:MAG: hypothetical protein AAF328_07355 [Planctomycetota bacterium]